MAKKLNESELNNVSGGCGYHPYYGSINAYADDGVCVYKDFLTSDDGSRDVVMGYIENTIEGMHNRQKRLIHFHWQIKKGTQVCEEGDRYF